LDMIRPQTLVLGVTQSLPTDSRFTETKEDIDTTMPPDTKCPHCPRLYCSSACCQADWPTHHFWCGKTGEKNVDFEVRQIQGKGLGLVTLRAFGRGEKILAERPVLTTKNMDSCHTSNTKHNNKNHNKNKNKATATRTKPAPCHAAKIHTNIRTAAMSLTPLEGDLGDKVNANGVSVGPTLEANDAAGLFLTFSRVNHDCVGNSDHYFDHQHGVELLVANTYIPTGQEITFPYTRTGKNRLKDLSWRGFTCHCKACNCPDWDFKLNQLTELENTVVELGGQPKVSQRAHAIDSAYTLLELFDEMKVSDRDYARIHYDLFQIFISTSQGFDQAQKHIGKAHEHALKFCGYREHENVQQFMQYCDHPETHANYRAMD